MRTSMKGTIGIVAAIAMIAPAAHAAEVEEGSGQLTAPQLAALAQGLQVAPKAGADAGSATLGPNPWLAFLPQQSDADYATWRKTMEKRADKRASSSKLKALRNEAFGAAPNAALPPAVVHDEEEPAGTLGSNDTHANAERVREFGTNKARSARVRILGEFAAVGGSTEETIETAPEDNGSIPLATQSGITDGGAVTTSSVLGDGPHGTEGDGSNDFDVVAVDVAEGETLTADTAGTDSGLDSVLAVYDAEGTLVAVDDDGGEGRLSLVTYTAAEAGTYYVLVAGYSFLGPLPADPFDSGSGAGLGDTGEYQLSISAQLLDTDYYSLRLRPGDVLGSVGEDAATGLKVRTPSGEERVGGVATDASSLYPPNSPLPGGGNTTVAYVAEEAGWYSVQVTGSTGRYDVSVEGFRPGTQQDRGRTQTVLLDFDPGRVNAGTWGGPGVRNVSPFSAFVPRWGIDRSQARRVENRALRIAQRNIDQEIQRQGLNPDVNVEVLNARTNPELIGQPNVSRVYVAGTIAETGISTIGIAQYIDPGNYGHEDEAIVLLDVLSAAAGPISSLNTFMDDSSDRVKFVSNAVGNVVAHEIGHTIGNYHTDNANDVGNVMDSGGSNFAQNLYGVGPDNIGGTADDVNVRFVTDTYSPAEGFTGEENTLNVTAWAYAGR